MNTTPDCVHLLKALSSFFDIPLSEYTDPCLHCHSSMTSQVAFSAFTAVGIAELRDYAADALSVWGGVNDFKHFLPRISSYCDSADPSLDLIDSEILSANSDMESGNPGPKRNRSRLNRSCTHSGLKF